MKVPQKPPGMVVIRPFLERVNSTLNFTQKTGTDIGFQVKFNVEFTRQAVNFS